MSPLMDRSKRAGRYLEWKVGIFAVGATLALGGMYLDQQWMVGVAILVLAAGMALRLLPSGAEPGEELEEDETGEAGNTPEP